VKRERGLFNALAAAIVLFLAVLALVGPGPWLDQARPAAGTALGSYNPLAGRVIAIDPGHGGADRGASHPDSDLSEKDIVLDLALRLRDLLVAAGVQVVLTREDDPPGKLGLANAENLGRRLEVARQAGAECFVSIHVNKFASSRYWGAQTFYWSEVPGSRALADHLQRALRAVQQGNRRGIVNLPYFVLRNNDVPAALVEVGFISHPEERQKLNDGAYRQQLAEALFRGLASFWAEVPRARGR